MRYTFAALAVAAFCALPARAEEGAERRSVEALKTLGVRQCAQPLEAVAGIIHSEDDYAYLNTWNEKDPDRHATMTLTSKVYADGPSVAALGVAPTASGSCDATFAQVFLVRELCATLRETTFKGWKHYADLGSVPLHEDPTSSSVVAAFVSTQEGCLIFKAGLLFFPAGAR